MSQTCSGDKLMALSGCFDLISVEVSIMGQILWGGLLSCKHGL